MHHDRFVYYATTVLPRYDLPPDVCDELLSMFAVAVLAYDHLNYYRLVFLNYNLVTCELLMAIGRPDLAAHRRTCRYSLLGQRMMWDDMVRLEPMLSRRVGHVVTVQALARRWLARREVAARRIQRGCYRWLWSSYTRDGKVGINPRLMLREVCQIDDVLVTREATNNKIVE